MYGDFFTIGVLILLAAMMPGPDFAIVVKNTIFQSRRAGIWTSLGVASATLIHISYCILGLALVIAKSIVLFNVIKILGAIYLIYLGIKCLLIKPEEQPHSEQQPKTTAKKFMSSMTAFRQGFLTNLLNPKATLFFLSLFTLVIKPTTPITIEILYGIENFIIVAAWFIFLSLILSHHRVVRVLNHVEHYISKILGTFLIGFGIALAFVRK